MDEVVWLASTDPRKMLEFLGDSVSERKLRLASLAAVRRVWQLLAEGPSRRCVEVADRYADGLADEGELAEAVRLAEGAFRAVRTEAHPSLLCAAWSVCSLGLAFGAKASSGLSWSGPLTAFRRPPAPALTPPCRKAADWEAMSGAGHATWATAYTGERAAQCALLGCIFGNPFRPPPAVAPALLAWNSGLVRRLAEDIYLERELPSGHLDGQRLAVLADALEEAGCTDQGILGHLRQRGAVHVRGCFVVDLLLGRGEAQATPSGVAE